MNDLLKSRRISEMDCDGNIAYVLNDNNEFDPAHYRFMQNESCLIKCMRESYNGQIQLYYLTSSIKPLLSITRGIDPDSFMIIMSSLMSDISEVKNNGFLSCENINISLDSVYVDFSTLKVNLIYLPIDEKLYSNPQHFENDLRTELVKLIMDTPSLSGIKIAKFKNNLQNGRIPLEKIISGLEPVEPPAVDIKGAVPGRGLKLISISAPERVELVVDKPSFVIGRRLAGRQLDEVDGCITDPKKNVGRVHCKIIKEGNQYKIADLQSKNHTYLNDRELEPLDSRGRIKYYSLNNGDVIGLGKHITVRAVIE